MNTIIILLIILFLVFSKLGKIAGRMPAPPGPKETDLPVPVELPGYSDEDDVPLSGPWNKDGGVAPGRGQTENQASTPVLMKPEPQKTGDMRHASESATCRQPVGHPVPLEAVRQQPEPGELVCPQGRSLPGQRQEHRKRRRGKNPLAAALNSKSELVGSILVGEIIGSRGGYRGKRK